ncbi:hypothetical protein FF2_035887 [Malus domestica]
MSQSPISSGLPQAGKGIRGTEIRLSELIYAFGLNALTKVIVSVNADDERRKIHGSWHDHGHGHEEETLLAISKLLKELTKKQDMKVHIWISSA